jgi:hypothetical protein
MFATGISKDTQATLEKIKSLPFLADYYLAGGTVVALYYGHRLSFDLDFFSPKPTSSMLITSQLKNLGELSVDTQEEGTWLGMLDKTKLSFFVYPYAQIAEEENWNSVRLASKQDLACMKMEAIASRGIKRDFIDMYYLTQEIGLEGILSVARSKFSEANISEIHFLRSLVYFEDADLSEEPIMLVPYDWDDIKRYFENEVLAITKKLGVGV